MLICFFENYHSLNYFSSKKELNDLLYFHSKFKNKLK
jgi:hypothetical protein